MKRNEDRAEAARHKARDIGDMLYEKQMAYGDSGAMALAIWQARLKQYINPEGTHYNIPVELIAHIPRLTRVDDRIARIVSNPAGDRLGEDPWVDLAGDAVIGAIMPRLNEEADVGLPPDPCWFHHPVTGRQCERTDAHDIHRYAHSGGVIEWRYGPAPRESSAPAPEEESMDPGETGVVV